MSFDVKSFKSQFGSGLRSHSYDVIVAGAPGLDGEVVRLRTESISLPGAAFMSVDNYKPYGGGVAFTLPYAWNTQEITCVHMVDDNASIIQGFNVWANLIAQSDPNSKYGAFYHNVYRRDIDINVYKLDGSKVKTIKLIEAFPIAVDQMQMSWGSNDEVAKLSVSYKFTTYKVT